jgi:small subunit ribosomal protein S6
MALYENVFIARQDVPTTQVEALTKQFTDLVTAQGGTVSKNEYWGLRSLTFRIRKNRKGHYTLLNIDAPPAAV